MLTDIRFFAILAAMTKDDFSLVSGRMTLVCWPLELYVEALPNKPASDLEITLKGPAGPDGARTLDKIIGTTGVKVVFDRVENAEEIGTLQTSGITVYATSKKQSGDVIVRAGVFHCFSY